VATTFADRCALLISQAGDPQLPALPV